MRSASAIAAVHIRERCVQHVDVPLEQCPLLCEDLCQQEVRRDKLPSVEDALLRAGFVGVEDFLRFKPKKILCLDRLNLGRDLIGEGILHFELSCGGNESLTGPFGVIMGLRNGKSVTSSSLVVEVNLILQPCDSVVDRAD